MTDSFNIIGIDKVIYGVEDIELGIQFFEDWGLRKVSLSKENAIFETRDRTEIVLLLADDPNLPPPIEKGSTVREIVWGVKDKNDLRNICEALSSETGFDENDDQPTCIDPNGLTISFRVTQRQKINAPAAPMNTFSAPDARIDQSSTFYERAEPLQIGHVVFFVSDVSLVEEFYTSKLGFIVSDRYPGSGSFLRCKAKSGHHSLFLLQTPDKNRGINHVAFNVRDIHEVFGGGLFLDRCGWKTQIGPGRHPVSSAYFWYIENPCGGLVEYFTDEDSLTEFWQPRNFEKTNENYAEWGISGGIDGYTRRQRNYD